MRFNTKTKKNKYRQDVINYLTDYGYGQDTAKYEVNNWIERGLNVLSPTVKEDIKQALLTISYGLKND